MATKYRSVRRILPRPPSHWVGDGFKVYPVFADMAFKEDLSPLLMFDYAEPKQFPARNGPPLGVGQVSASHGRQRAVNPAGGRLMLVVEHAVV